MSHLQIQNYLNNLSDLRKVSGTHRESVVREAFKDLLKGWGKSLDLIFVPEYEIETPAKERRYVDGALLYELRVPFGYWEAKDEKDDLETEIQLKFSRGYPMRGLLRCLSYQETPFCYPLVSCPEFPSICYLRDEIQNLATKHERLLLSNVGFIFLLPVALI